MTDAAGTPEVGSLSLTHYSATPFRFDPARRYEQLACAMKPSGLWLSVDGEDDWPAWCRSEDFNVESLAHAARFRLAPDAHVLTMTTPNDLVVFARDYGGPMTPMTPMVLWIDWSQVADDYDGLIITPYLWSMRFDSRAYWYYGWDCASGCVWTLAALDPAS